MFICSFINTPANFKSENSSYLYSVMTNIKNKFRTSKTFPLPLASNIDEKSIYLAQLKDHFLQRL